jgi:RNA polymerase sigma-B factor
VIEALPPREHTVLYLRFFESWPQSQIAEHLGISQMQVSRMLNKTLRALREQL